MGQHEDAININLEILQTAPNYSDVHLNIANSYSATNNPAKAVEHYQKALESDEIQKDISAWINYANELGKLNRISSGLDAIDKALSINNQSYAAHIVKGNLLNSLGYHEQSINEYDTALNLNPDSIDAHNNKGVAFENLGLFTQALSEYEKALQKNPDYVYALKNKIRTIEKIKMYGNESEQNRYVISQLKLVKPNEIKIIPHFCPTEELSTRAFPDDNNPKEIIVDRILRYSNSSWDFYIHNNSDRQLFPTFYIECIKRLSNKS